MQLIKFSPKRLNLFDSLRKEISLNSGEITPSLRMLCPTRWTVRHTSIQSILQNYEVLQSTLEEVQKGHDDYGAKANGLLSKMEKFDTFFSLKLGYLIFSAAEQLSINLQSKDITIQEAIRGATLLSSYLQSLRNEEKFNAFYDQILHESSTLTEEPSLPRRRKVPQRLDDGSSGHVYETPKEKYQHA